MPIKKTISVVLPATSSKQLYNFQTNFLSKFQDDFNKESWRNNADFVTKAVMSLYEMEEPGIIDGLDAAYYDAYNEALARGFNKGFNEKHSLTYMGYKLIKKELSEAEAESRYADPKKKKEKDSPLRIVKIGREYISILDGAFLKYTKEERANFDKSSSKRAVHQIKDLDITNKNRNLYPGTLNILSSANKGYGITPFDSSSYMTFPVWERGHLTDDDEKGNVTAFVKALIKNYGQKGGCSALLEAGVGTGKTYAIAKSIAPLLGRILGTEVSMLMPTTPQIAQIHEQYGANTNYGATTDADKIGSDSITAVIYDKADEIAITTPDGRPVVLIIDEAHMLFTDEGYRSTAMKKIKNAASKILEMGGIVLAMTASSEIVASTMPYNSARGYDLVAIAYRVTSKNNIGNIQYPDYEYSDVITDGKKNGVEIVSAIPADKIEIAYRLTGADIEKYVIQAILNERKDNMLVVIENNDKDSNQKITNILTNLGIKVGIISADDKGYKFDHNNNCRVYNNMSYEDIVNNGCIDRDKVQVIITTKLLENGTSISHIKKDNGISDDISIQQYNVVTYHIVKRAQDFDIQAFEQFSGRIRCRHKKACLLIPYVINANKPFYADLSYYIKTIAAKKVAQIKALSENVIDDDRLGYIDFYDNHDFEADVLSKAGVTASLISRNVFKALKNYYKSLMYNKLAFENFIRDRYITKDVSFIEMPEPDIDIEKGRKIVEASYHNVLAQAIEDAYKSTRDNNVKTKLETRENLVKTLNNVARGSYKDNIQNILATRSVMEDIKTGKIQSKSFKSSYINIDISDDANKEFIKSVQESAVSTAKKDSGAILNDVNMAFLQSIIRIKGIDEILKRYAYRKTKHDDYEAAVFIEDAVKLMGLKDFADNMRMTEAMTQLVKSDKFQAVLTIISTCGYLTYDLDELCRYASKNSYDKLNQTVLCYECFMMSENPGTAHREFTSSGRQFTYLLSKEAYDVCEFRVPFNNNGMADKYAWVNKTLDASKFLALASILQKNMSKNGENTSRDTGYFARRILHVFCTLFHVKVRKKEDSVIYTLTAVRENLPSDFTKILSYNFKTYPASAEGINIFTGIDLSDKRAGKHKRAELDTLENEDVFMTEDGYLARSLEWFSRDRKKYFAVYAGSGTWDSKNALGYHECDMSGNVLSTELTENKTVKMTYINGSDKDSFKEQSTVVRYVMDEEEFKDFLASDKTRGYLFSQALFGAYQVDDYYTGPFVNMSPKASIA